MKPQLFTCAFISSVALALSLPSHAIENQSAWGTITDYAEGISETVKGYFTDNKDDIKKNSVEISKKAGEIAADTANGIGNFAKEHKDEIADLATKTGKALGAAAAETADAVGDFTRKHKGDIAAMAETAGKKAGELASDTAKALGN